MKTLKNDTRYIIKRVLIGVLIAIVLFNARKCGVYAETKDIYVIAYVNSDSVGLTTLSTNVGNRVNFCNTTINDINFHFYTESNNATNYNDCYVFLFQNPNNTNEYSFQFVPFDRGNLIFSAITSNTFLSFEGTYTSTNTSGVFSSPPNYYLNNLDTNFGVESKSNIYNQNYPHLSTYSGYAIFNINNVTNAYQNFSVRNSNNTRWRSEYYNIITTWSLYSNSEVPIKIYDEVKFEPAPLFPPTGYSELSLKNYQGVVFVPKNYNNIECSVVGDLCNTTFNYYYQEEIKEAYFPLDNRFNIRFNSDFLNSPNEPSELKSTYFPISQVSSNETFYYAFMIYNYTNDGSPLDPETYYAYGDAKVWYDSTLWNYYLVDDFNNWSANVCYMLDGNEVCTTISGLPTLKDAIEQAQLEQNILGTHVGDLNLFSSLIRFPLSFVQSLSSDSCTAIQLPPLPFIGGNISLPCMSLIYQQVLGIYQPVISGFINFIIIYYLILAIIKFYNKTFDPSHTEIEVIDL